MNLSVINTGSLSVKFTLFRSEGMHSAVSGLVERIGLEGTAVHGRNERGERITQSVTVRDIRGVISDLVSDPEKGVTCSDNEISTVGHWFVHGGEEVKNSILIDDDVRAVIHSCFDLTPLHNLPNLSGIYACAELFPYAPQAAIFDTVFHNTLPEYAYLYALPYWLYQTEKIRRYGVHGKSHWYVSRKASESIGRPLEDFRMVTCHCLHCRDRRKLSLDPGMDLQGVGETRYPN